MRTNKYISLQLPKEMNTRGRITPMPSFSHKCTEFRLKSFKNIMLITSNNINMLGDLKTYVCSVAHGVRRCTEIRGAPIRVPCNYGQRSLHISSNSTVASTNAFLYQFCICQHLSDKFRVGFGVVHISNKIEHSFLTTVPGYLNSEPPQYVPEPT